MATKSVPVLDAFSWQQNVKGRLADPPGSPARGDRYLVIATASGDWAGKENQIAYCSNATGPVWSFIVPTEGWIFWVDNENFYYRYDGTSWINLLGKWEDTMIAPYSAREGVVAPTWEGGFKGDSNMYCLNFVNTQADEIQFTIQLPHARKTNSTIYPHVHFTPYTALGAGSYAAQFILKYYYAAINGSFSAEQSVTMTKTWSNEQQWVHMIASVAGSTLNTGISSILQCRLYRDNTVANNFGGKLTILGFDIHIEIDTPGGSREEAAK